jgi:basic amino acid/polyamine antiporter, APA family
MTLASVEQSSPTPAPAALVRTLNLPLAVLFGLGVTIGAGIYVLIGATADGHHRRIDLRRRDRQG